MDRGHFSDKHFAEFSEFANRTLGIKMPPKKKQMLKCRIMRRIRELHMGTFDEYYKYVFHKGGLEVEMQNLINAVTTNKTDFFRESKHFDYLIQTALPSILNEPKRNQNNPIIVWCAGCSSGEEAYTLAMTLQEYKQTHSGFDYSILATDISTKVLHMAHQGIYDESKIHPIPFALKRKYLQKSKSPDGKVVRFIPELRSKIRYQQLNFMDAEYKNIPTPIDVIFFRNVMIYFDSKTQETIINKMGGKLAPWGYLFTGHSESLKDLDIPVKAISTAVYRKSRG